MNDWEEHNQTFDLWMSKQSPSAGPGRHPDTDGLHVVTLTGWPIKRQGGPDVNLASGEAALTQCGTGNETELTDWMPLGWAAAPMSMRRGTSQRSTSLHSWTGFLSAQHEKTVLERRGSREQHTSEWLLPWDKLLLWL